MLKAQDCPLIQLPLFPFDKPRHYLTSKYTILQLRCDRNTQCFYTSLTVLSLCYVERTTISLPLNFASSKPSSEISFTSKAISLSIKITCKKRRTSSSKEIYIGGKSCTESHTTICGCNTESPLTETRPNTRKENRTDFSGHLKL